MDDETVDRFNRWFVLLHMHEMGIKPTPEQMDMLIKGNTNGDTQVSEDIPA